MNKATMILTTSALALASAFADEPPAPPAATVTEIAEKTVAVKDKGPVTLDAAYKFEATEKSTTYAGWIADFVVTFDRDVAAGGVELYGQADVYDDDWIAWGLGAAQANEPMRLVNEPDLTYSTLLDYMHVFNCGAKSDISGLGMTVELRLYDPYDEDDWVTIARVKHTFAGKWFDARVEQYEDWPDDAEKAYGGAWDAPENAKVMTPGELFVNGDICFNADVEKTLGTDVKKATVEGVAEFSTLEGAGFPDVLDAAKGAVLVAKDGDEPSYYAIARDGVGETNAWVKLEGPAVEEGMTPFRITFARKWIGTEYRTYVTYNLRGTDYAYNGDAEIEVVDNDHVLRSVGFGGSGTLSSLSATVERIRRGMMYFVK